jgi:hypothetical protein
VETALLGCQNERHEIDALVDSHDEPMPDEVILLGRLAEAASEAEHELSGLAGIGSGSEDVLELIRVLAVVHFANFLTAFAALGLGAGAFAYGLAWTAGAAPRWLGRLGLIAAGLLVLTPLAVTAEFLSLPFFFGTILTLVWLLAAGLWLALRPPGARVAGDE